VAIALIKFTFTQQSAFFPECLLLPEKMLLRCKVENKGVFTVVLKRRFNGSGVVATVFGTQKQ